MDKCEKSLYNLWSAIIVNVCTISSPLPVRENEDLLLNSADSTSRDDHNEKNNEDEEENNLERRKAKEGRRQEGLDPLRLEEIFALEHESYWSSEFGSELVIFAKLLSSQSILTPFLL